MGLRRVVKKGLKSYNPKRWLYSEQLKHDAGFIKQLFGRTVRLNQPQASDQPKDTSFDAAVQRLGLSEKDLQQQAGSAKRLVFVFTIAFLFLMVYSVYQWCAIGFFGGFISSVLTVLMGLYAYREHLKWYQITHRCLKCSYRDVLRSLVGQLVRRGSK